ncbi:hypothetical protein ECBCE034MS14_0875 [Escherichia coli BCE034_MS-14]|nr:hypothetical protein ECBCE034MS14_0875 [Escherichia coli BCE034_MS-14]
MLVYVRKNLNMMLRVVTLPHSLNQPPNGVFYARKAAQYVKRAGGCEYGSFSLLAFPTRVIGMSR